jgi:hypothetical protein
MIRIEGIGKDSEGFFVKAGCLGREVVSQMEVL